LVPGAQQKKDLKELNHTKGKVPLIALQRNETLRLKNKPCRDKNFILARGGD